MNYYIIEYFDIVKCQWMICNKVKSRATALRNLEDLKRCFSSVKYRLYYVKRLK